LAGRKLTADDMGKRSIFEQNWNTRVSDNSAKDHKTWIDNGNFLSLLDLTLLSNNALRPKSRSIDSNPLKSANRYLQTIYRKSSLPINRTPFLTSAQGVT